MILEGKRSLIVQSTTYDDAQNTKRGSFCCDARGSIRKDLPLTVVPVETQRKFQTFILVATEIPFESTVIKTSASAGTALLYCMVYIIYHTFTMKN